MNITTLPVVSEKALALAEQGTYVFEVPLGASKAQVADAVSGAYKVKVSDVRTTVVKGKVKSFRRIRGKRPDRKKAYVTLKEGQSINLFGEQK